MAWQRVKRQETYVTLITFLFRSLRMAKWWSLSIIYLSLRFLMQNRLKHIIVISSERSGSTWLTELLNSHNNINITGGILNLHNQGKIDQHHQLKYNNSLLPIYIRANLVPTFRQIVLSLWCKHNSYTGFKLFHWQCSEMGTDLDEILQIMRNPDIILLYRNNLLERFVSHEIALDNGRWYSAQQVNSNSIIIDKYNLKEYVMKAVQYWLDVVEDLSESRSTIFTLSYNRLLDGKSAALNKLFSKLELLPMKCTSRCIKQNPLPLTKMVENYTEIAYFVQSNDISLEMGNNWKDKLNQYIQL